MITPVCANEVILYDMGKLIDAKPQQNAMIWNKPWQNTTKHNKACMYQ